MLVSGGTIDGLLGGGIAFDNVNGKATNAVANTESVTIEVTGGEINAANVDPITKPIQGEHAGVPSRGSHVHQVAKTLGKDGANVAILGGGVASGAGAESTIQNVKPFLTAARSTTTSSPVVWQLLVARPPLKKALCSGQWRRSHRQYLWWRRGRQLSERSIRR